MLWERIPQEDQVSFSTRNFLEWKKRTEIFEQIGAFTGNRFTLSGGGEPDLVFGQMVTPSLFAVLGVPPALGRSFLESESEPGRDHEVVLSQALWRSKFGGRQDVIGRAIRMNGESYTVVGVMPEGFDFPSPRYSLWVPAALGGAVFQQHPDAHFLRVIGRLKPGITEARLIFGVTIHDPLTFAGIPVFMIIVTLPASYLPARRATRADPLRSVRYE